MSRLTDPIMRRARRYAVGTFAATILCFAMATAHAQGLVEYEFTGMVTDNSGDLGVFGPFGAVQINDVFTGRFAYLTGPGNPDQEPGNSEMGFYNVANFVIDQAVVPITPIGVGVLHEPGVPTLPPLPPDLGTDGFVIAGTIPFEGGIRAVSLRLETSYQAVFTDDSLPTSLVLSDFTELQTVVSIRAIGLPPAMSFIDAGQLTSLVQVPEPGSVSLLLISVAGVSLMRRRRSPRRSSARRRRR